MYIEPNTTIRILRNCPLDNTFEHTIYFALEPEQEAYFKKLTKYTLTRQTYQRVNNGVMRVQIKAENLYDCNYLMFQNESFGDKWFYAFIESVEYVNNITSEITFELDPMQTWFFDYDLGQCFVEREHTVRDDIGGNIVEEKLDCGEYFTKSSTAGVWGDDLSIIILASFDSDYNDQSLSMYNRSFSGLYITSFPNTVAGAKSARDFINGAAEKTKLDGIVGVGLMPTKLMSLGNGLDTGGGISIETFAVNKQYLNVRSDGKPPKNKKLYIYPYNYFEISNNLNDSKIYKYEFFTENACNFSVYGETALNPNIIAVPDSTYKGNGLDFNNAVTMNSFPLLPWSGDAYKAWLAQTSSGNTIAGLSALATAIVGGLSAAATGSVAGAIMAGSTLSSVASKAGQLISKNRVASQLPNVPHNGQGCYIFSGLGISDFLISRKYLSPEYVTIIDDYFTAFGYACHELKVPNRNVRPHWTYTKTVNCVLTGSLPCDDANKICSIYNNGITFWRNGDEVGNYNLDNSPEES